MDTNSTAQLVDLAAPAQQPDEPAALLDLLAEATGPGARASPRSAPASSR
ncbi:hypothetical protein ABZ835_47100 [Streptomyces sp. NPDC047461]